MRPNLRTLAIPLVLIAFGVASHADDPSCGTIATAGAVIEVGAAPTQGHVTQEPCAREEERPALPQMPQLGTIGTFTVSPGTYEPPPDISPAVPGAFHATSGVVISAGDHVYTSFAIDSGVSVSVASGAEIWTTGDVLIEGTLRFSGAGLLHCGGDLTIDGGDDSAMVETGGTNGPVDFQVGGSFHCGTRDSVTSARMGLRIETFGVPPASGHVVLEGNLWAIQEDMHVVASGGVHMTGDEPRIEVDYGTLRMHAFGGDIVLDSHARIAPADSDEAAPAVLESSGSIRVLGGSEIDAGHRCAVQISAFGGDVLIEESSVYSAGETDDGWVRASGSIVIDGEDSYLDLDCGDHAADVRAFGGAVEFRDVEGEDQRSYIGGSVVSIAAATDVRLERVGLDTYSNSDSAPTQLLTVHAHDGDIFCDGRVDLGTQTGWPGKATLQASDGIALACSEESRLWVNGTGGMELFAGPGGIDLDAPFVQSRGGDTALLTEGTIVLDTELESGGDVTIVSTGSWVDAPGCSIVTLNASADATSGSVVIESWRGASGRVDVSNATLRTGSSATWSGDVVLRVVQAGGAVELDSYLLPKSVRTKPGRKDAAASLMTLRGDLDLGTSGPDLTGPTELRIGDRTLDLPGLTANKKGNKLAYRDEVLDLEVNTDKSGSSHGRFTIRLRGDPAAVGDPDGTLSLGLSCDDMDARCAVALAAGGFKRGKVRGAVVEPSIRIAKAKVVVKGAGNDKLSLKLGLNTGTVTPGAAPDVALQLGDAWNVVLAGDQFKAKKETFRFKGDVAGIRKATLDYGKEALSLSGRGLDLGPHVGADGLVRLRVRVAGEEYAVRVRLRTKGALLTY